MEKFHIRFGIDVGEEEARRRFVNRSVNEIFFSFYYNLYDYNKIKRRIFTLLGESDRDNQSLLDHLEDNFLRHLQAIEAFYAAIETSDSGNRKKLERLCSQPFVAK